MKISKQKIYFCACFYILISLQIQTLNAADIELPAPKKNFQTDLGAALEQRKSAEKITAKPVSLENLSTILWAAIGINRKDGKRTAPLAFDKDYIKLYVIMDGGVYLYNPQKNLLKKILEKNIKKNIANSKLAETAALSILLAADISELPFYVKAPLKNAYANANVGCIAQNIYLAAAALKLETRMIGYIKDTDIIKELNFSKNEIPLYVMPLGYAAE